MRIKDLFTVPEGERVTEKVFGRVLLSSVCGILLCMACLAGTTWAWFTVSIENQENEIQIATVTPVVEVKKGEIVISPVDDAGYSLEEGTYTLAARLENDATATDDLNRNQRNVYLVMIVTHENVSKSYFFALDGKQEESITLNELKITGGTATVSFSVSWVEPASAAAAGSKALVIGEAPAEPSMETA